jgi:hypothetical protein
MLEKPPRKFSKKTAAEKRESLSNLDAPYEAAHSQRK